MATTQRLDRTSILIILQLLVLLVSGLAGYTLTGISADVDNLEKGQTEIKVDLAELKPRVSTLENGFFLLDEKVEKRTDKRFNSDDAEKLKAWVRAEFQRKVNNLQNE